MKVGFNILPLKNGHKTRGVGSYARSLLENLKKREDIDIVEFENISDIKDVDLVHFSWFDLFYKTLPLRKKFPTVVTVHDVIPLLFPNEYPKGLRGKINLEIQKIALRGCKQIISVSETSKKDISKYLKIGENKIKVVYSAAEEYFKILSDAQVLKVKRKYNLPDRFLLYVGDANFNKNLPFLIKGFKKFREIHLFRDVKLVLIGGAFLKILDNIDHPELKSLKTVLELIKDLKEEVITPGQIDTDEIVVFYNLATVYVQPSLYEGFGLPILEAFRCGTPVLSSNISSLREVGGNAAIYFNPDDKEQFVRLLGDVLQSRSLQAKLSKSGLNRADEFSWEKTADETIKVYQKATLR